MQIESTDVLIAGDESRLRRCIRSEDLVLRVGTLGDRGPASAGRPRPAPQDGSMRVEGCTAGRRLGTPRLLPSGDHR